MPYVIERTYDYGNVYYWVKGKGFSVQHPNLATRFTSKQAARETAHRILGQFSPQALRIIQVARTYKEIGRLAYQTTGKTVVF